jgi:hypothetical protein
MRNSTVWNTPDYQVTRIKASGFLTLWGQGFGSAAELPLGAELYVSAGSAGDLVAGVRTNRLPFPLTVEESSVTISP